MSRPDKTAERLDIFVCGHCGRTAPPSPAGPEWAILHRCRNRGFIRANRVASEDNESLLFALAALPLSRLPFSPRETLERWATGELLGGAG